MSGEQQVELGGHPAPELPHVEDASHFLEQLFEYSFEGLPVLFVEGELIVEVFLEALVDQCGCLVGEPLLSL